MKYLEWEICTWSSDEATESETDCGHWVYGPWTGKGTRVKVIEYGAYLNTLARVDSLEQSLILAKQQRDQMEVERSDYRDRLKATELERVATKIAYDELISYLPKVPTQPYEKELARKLAVTVAALEKIADPRKRDHKEPDAYTTLGCVMHIADEALGELKS